MKFLRISILTALHVCLIFLHTSCIREEMNACVQYKLNTQAVDEQGNDLTGRDTGKIGSLSVWRKRIYKNDTGKSIVGISLLETIRAKD